MSTEPKNLLHKFYDFDSLSDLERDVSECYDSSIIQTDDDGYFDGEIEVIVRYIPNTEE